MDLQLAGKRALVSGSTAGIGFAIVEALAREGCEVIVNGRTEARVSDAIIRIRSRHPQSRLHPLPADLGNAAGAAAAIEKFSDVDILINNVGIFEPKPFEQITDADWFRFFEVNVMSGVRLGRHHLPRMKQRNDGRIIFISSESGLQIPAEMIHYGMTKTAQIAVARGMAETTSGTNVTVNSVLPGPTASEGVSEFVGRLAESRSETREKFEKDFFASARPSSILQRFEEPREIAELVAFIASPLSSAINGAAIRADGGVVRSIA